MIKQCICSMCDKKFDYDKYGDDFEIECFKHEVIKHLNGDKKCKGIIKDAINDLNQKYKADYKIDKYDFNPYYSYYGQGENQIGISFTLKTNDEYIKLTLETQLVDNTINLTKEGVIRLLKPHYIQNIEKTYVGVVEFEDCCGGHGEDDYVINGIYVRDIMKRLKGKKIEIRIL